MPFPFVLGNYSGGGGPADVTPPTIANITPPEGSTLSPRQPISLDVQDDSGLATVMLLARFRQLAAPELVHDGLSFSPPYVKGSTREGIEGGWRYTILREGGWPSPPKLLLYVRDAGGNEAQEAED